MTLLAPFGLIAGLLALPVLVAHILTPRRDRRPVSSTYLWRSVLEPMAPSRPWQRIRWSVPLVLQLLLVALLALALAQPALVGTAVLEEHTVFVVDTSASMRAADESPDRLEAAKDRIDALLSDLPAGAEVSLVVAGSPSEIVASQIDDLDRFRTELDRVRPSSGPADFAQAFVLAESLVSSDRATGFVFVSDGGVDADQQALAPPGMTYVAVGAEDVNRAVTGLAVRRDDAGLTAVVTLTNTGGPTATQPLRVDVDNVTVARRQVTLDAGATTEIDVPIPPGARVEAFLDGDDLLLLDNQRAALAPFVTDLRVRVETASDRGSFFVSEALQAVGAIEVTGRSAPVDLVVYDGVDPPRVPDTPFISISSPNPPTGVRVVGAVDRPIPTLLSDDALLSGIDITSTAIASAQALQVETGEVLIGAAGGEPLLVRGRSGPIGWFHLAFDLEQSNLPIEVAYPVLVARMVAALTLSDDVPASVEVGGRLPPLTEPVVVTSPHGVARRIDAGGRMPLLDETGFWTVTEPDGTVRPVAAVFPSAESSLKVAVQLDHVPAAEGSAEGSETRASTTEPLLEWVLVAALLIVLVELVISLRSVGPPRLQRVLGTALRVVIVSCLVGALLGLELTRTNGDVRAVLVLDRSDSLGDDGRARVDEVLAALEPAIASGRVAVVDVGDTARVVNPFDGAVRSGASPAGDGTDLIAGLRLADSLLDGSSRERVVIVSDGRSTTGDVVDEADRLAGRVAVDVIGIEPASVVDVGVDGVKAPGSVAEGEAYVGEVVLVASEPTSVTIELARDDIVVAERDVDLVPGENRVGFDLVAESGVDRLRARLVRHADDIEENDAAYAALHVEGPPRVLIVEGRPDNALLLAEGLDARTLLNDVVGVDRFPTPDELAAYQAVVLVDVHRDDLADENVTSLSGFVRDQGNGLVVIGGSNSFALGDYGESDLEDLLPIESRAGDPLRDASIAEVLLIDASESMGTCHCRPFEGSSDPFDGEFIDNGVNKTDISKAAAARAVDALDPQDDIGILAFNGNQTWVLPLQALPEQATIEESLGGLTPTGETRIGPALEEAAVALRANEKELRHIIMFTDGFSPELMDEGFGDEFGALELGDLEAQAAELADEGITVSVVATGEGAAPLLEAVALAGGGRFYPGRDLEEIPEIFVEEARIASRSFINEGRFVPTVTSTADPVRDLEAAPAVTGFVAGTAKDTADVMLQVGEFSDPLLASWRIGLGRVTTWASDSGERWSAEWASWDGWADFWSNVVRDALPLEGASGAELRASMVGASLALELVGEDAWPAGAAPVASIAAPDGTSTVVTLTRTSSTSFTALVPAAEVGSYAIGVHTSDDDATARVGTAVATRSYSLEYRPGPPAVDDLVTLSTATEGRGLVTPEAILDPEGLDPGETARPLRWILLLVAALLWPLAVLLRHTNLRQLPDDLRATRAARRRRSAAHPSTPPRPAGASG